MNRNLLILGTVALIGGGLLYYGKKNAPSGSSQTVEQESGFQLPEIDLPEIERAIYNISQSPINAVTTPALNFIMQSGPPLIPGNTLLQIVGAQPRDINMLLLTPDSGDNAPACNVCSVADDNGPIAPAPSVQQTRAGGLKIQETAKQRETTIYLDELGSAGKNSDAIWFEMMR